MDNSVSRLLSWYEKNARDLPWRHDITPYRVWVSEIMLQQTRVEAVKPYYIRFLKELPDVYALADCPDDRLLKLWEGLGYYSRVRNMKKAARIVVDRFGGNFPSDPIELRKLPGIGAYTAGAIASIAYKIPAPAVDGNVLRVISRYQGIFDDILDPKTRKTVEKTVSEMIPKDRADTFTQALIELGAAVCMPDGAALCSKCPLSRNCAAKNGTNGADPSVLPVKSKQKPRKIVFLTVLLLKDGERYAIRKRPEKGLLAGLYELPNVVGTLTEAEAIREARGLGFDPLRIEKLPDAKHVFTHIEWHMSAYLVGGHAEENCPLLFADREELSGVYALPSAFSAYNPA